MILGILVLVVPTIGLGYSYLNSAVGSTINGAIGGGEGGPTPTIPPTIPPTLPPTPTPTASIVTGTDLALAGTASSLLTQDGEQAPSNINDGNDATYAISNYGLPGEWYQVDLGSPQAVGSVRLFQVSGGVRPATVSFQFSNDLTSWTTAATVTDNAWDLSATMTGTGRYWRVVDAVADAWWGIWTFSLFAA